MKTSDLSFDEIRPYRDEEVNEVLSQIATKPSFLKLISYMFPRLSSKDIQEGFAHIHSVSAFQALYIHQGMRSLASNSTDGLSYEGIKQLDKKTPYLFLSNHRDIILDSAFLNILLFEHGVDTTEIAIGDNLMVSPLVTDLMKLNKSFIVHRNAPRRLLPSYSKRLSQYIRHVLQEKEQSVWIAQRNGRTKDGVDQTAPGLLKMLSLSREEGLAASFAKLNLTAVAISYEYEPCAGLKAEELLHQELGLPYTKDDKTAIIQGIRAQKGRVHLAVGQPIKDFSVMDGPTERSNDWLRALAHLLDQEIDRLYKRWPTNYIASDLWLQEDRYTNHYSEQEKERFQQYLDHQVSLHKGDPFLLRQKVLEIYAGPVLGKQVLSSVE
ncbi:MAG: 1-acyl-sn-glycerol-3-phosphate acyltransferase [Bacteroidota bacterium]